MIIQILSLTLFAQSLCAASDERRRLISGGDNESQNALFDVAITGNIGETQRALQSFSPQEIAQLTDDDLAFIAEQQSSSHVRRFSALDTVAKRINLIVAGLCGLSIFIKTATHLTPGASEFDVSDVSYEMVGIGVPTIIISIARGLSAIQSSFVLEERAKTVGLLREAIAKAKAQLISNDNVS